MIKAKRVSSPIYTFFPTEVEGFNSLAELALDMRWSWNHASDEIWRHLDPVLWDLTHHPCDVLQTVSREKLRSELADPNFRKKIDAFIQIKKRVEDAPAWFQQAHPQSPLKCIAYFCMEFMLSDALPIYSGGLGNVAGDQLKAASDLGVPVVGVGLLYQQGYFRQLIDRDGVQQALYPYNDPGQLPITPLRKANGEWLRLEVLLSGSSLWLRAWQVQVGRVTLYLLDSNDVANTPTQRGITSELYGGGAELRLKQEMVLGVGGWRLLRALGLQPEVCHLNEGHAAFAVLERAREFMGETGQPFDVALAATRVGNLFTTHTAVDAGFDRFSPALIEQYLGKHTNKLGISLDQLLALGRRNPKDATEPFNMAYLAIRGSGAVNGVSRLHAKVSRHLFEPLFPNYPHEEIPVGYVTNGVHMPTWDSEEADELWTEACGKDRWLGTAEIMGQNMRRVSDTKIWQFRIAASQSFVDFVQRRLEKQMAARGTSPEELKQVQHIFDPNVLTLGFARRFATYKRPNLLLHDPERLMRLLTNPLRPVQLILAGKAHPSDLPGKELIRQWMQFIRRPEIRRHVIFLSDYNMLLSEYMVQGVDLWINTPRRPWEACGTSGMKVLVNGGLNLSELDGWWAEAYTPEVGWALGDGKEHGDDPAWDAHEANELYDLLEREIIPEYYARNEQGIPTAWVNRIRESMAQLTPQYSSGRAVREYTEKYYLPAAMAYRQRSANQGKIAAQVVNSSRELEQKWGTIRFGEVKIESAGEINIFELQIYLDSLDPETVRAELYADGINGNAAERIEMKRARQLLGAGNSFAYRAEVAALRPASDYTARLIPCHEGVIIPLEETHILWQK
jgi:starch phosphorylase